jgi:hypothetical protein
MFRQSCTSIGSRPFFATLLLATVIAPAAIPRLSNGEEEPGMEFYNERIQPTLRKRCYACHSSEAETLEAELRLDSRFGILRGGDSGPAFDAKMPLDSLIVRAIEHQDGLEMPPESPRLSAEIVADFRRWALLGMPMPKGSQDDVTSQQWGKKAREHWAFQPVEEVHVPKTVDRSWPTNPVDSFVLQKLEARGWTPSPEATREDWIRRVYFDLHGLPPTPEEITQFVNDTSINAYERVVDRLLASPRYGEKWAQHWLDVVRFAESEGYEYDRHLPGAWRYRDYVVSSLNAGKPYDQFITEQIAGDELAEHDSNEAQSAGIEHRPDGKRAEYLSAAVFHRLGPVRRNAGNPEIALSRNEVLTERTNILGDAFLGLSVGCARCHNHKLEPIAQRDYYRLQAYLAAAHEDNVSLVSEEEQKAWSETTDRINAEIKAVKAKVSKANETEAASLRETLAELETQLPVPLPTIPTVRNDPQQRTTVHVLRRGEWELKGAAVGPRPLSILVPEMLPELPAEHPAARTELAKWLTDSSHPLTSRVMVNRLWQHHFGAGIVKTPNDFGTKGAAPSHPELLDWLAGELTVGGWRLKPIHRLLVLSATYRQSSNVDDMVAENIEAAKIDPENRMLSHFSRRRLSAEEIRNTMLAVSGQLNLRVGGPSVIVPVDAELTRLLYKPAQWAVTADKAEHYRMSIYLLAKRNLRLPFMEAFDAPPLQTSCPSRQSSTHAPQTLELLNGTFANEIAAAFAQRLSQESAGDVQRMVDLAFRLTTGRTPTTAERQLALAFASSQPTDEFALAMLNLNGFLYVR